MVLFLKLRANLARSGRYRDYRQRNSTEESLAVMVAMFDGNMEFLY